MHHQWDADKVLDRVAAIYADAHKGAAEVWGTSAEILNVMNDTLSYTHRLCLIDAARARAFAVPTMISDKVGVQLAEIVAERLNSRDTSDNRSWPRDRLAC